jgi:hypothetical protein
MRSRVRIRVPSSLNADSGLSSAGGQGDATLPVMIRT